MGAEVFHAAAFWLAAEAVGLVGLPYAGIVLARLPGRGFALARPLGFLLCFYPAWLLAAVGLVPYGTWSLLASVLAVSAGALALALRAGALGGLHGVPLRLWLAGEAVFAAAFGLWAAMRSLAPDVWLTEKPMDMAIVNAINRSTSFPPHDPWLSGHDLNYYYYGHYLVAALVRLTGIDPAVGYNLGVALYYALCAAAVFAVASALYLVARRDGGAPQVSPVVVGLVAIAIAVVLGNLAAGTQLLDHGFSLSSYDWFAPSRVIRGTANEFPFFSFLLGDLHAHVMATPFTLLVVAFALQVAVAGPLLRGLRAAAELLVAALALGVLYAVNTLDFPTAALVLGLAVLVRATSGRERRAALVAWFLAVLGGALLLWLPFVVRFSPSTHGLGVLGDHDPFSRFTRDIALIFGLALALVAPAFAARLRMPARYAVLAAIGAVFVLTLLAPANLAGLVLVLSLTAVALGAALDARLSVPLRFWWLLCATGIGLVAAGEVVFIRDAFAGTASYRFNTVFKTEYQAWFLLAIVGACALFWSARWIGRRARLVWQLALVPIAALALAYPVAGSWARAAQSNTPVTLDGLRWLERSRPDDARAIGWLRRNVHGAPTILETVGPDFDPNGAARVSTFTGLPAVLGWAGHELQWGHKPGRRGADVIAIYSTPSARRARALLRRYGVRYVFVGGLERAEYAPASLEKFRRIGTPVFRSGRTVVYRVDG